MKSHIRDYATEAYRFYARVGGKGKYLRQLQDEYGKGRGVGVVSLPEGVLVTKEKILELHAAEFADLEAVERAIYLASLSVSGTEMKKCIEVVYFQGCWEEQRGWMSRRIERAVKEIPASDRQVKRWLKQARQIFALERGLRISVRR